MTSHPCSPEGRQRALERMGIEPVDLLIIGGGITGCGLARDAALRGLKVALVEKEDFAYGTSSRSSKLIHGGVRYLENREVDLVRESAQERKVLQHIAPHLVHPIPFILPFYKGQSTAKYRAGFAIFDKLARATRSEKHKILNAKQVREFAPSLREQLKGGIVYGEYITEDARFTLLNALSAANNGALIANHTAVENFRLQDDNVVGARVRDTLTGETYEVTAKVTVNATGPWAERTLLDADFSPPKNLLLSKGIHIIFPAALIPLEGAVALSSPSGKEGFAIRRWDYVYVGTTDIPYDDTIDQPEADTAAIEHLLTMTKECFPHIHISTADIIGTWAGLRPLIDEGKSARDTSRNDEIWKIANGMLTIAGGKLTTYRLMANRIMKHVANELNIEHKENPRTKEDILPGGELGKDFPTFQTEMISILTNKGITTVTAERLTWLYGTAINELLRYGEEEPVWLEQLAPEVNALKGEVRLAIEQEMAMSLIDFMDRRSALLLFSKNNGIDAVQTVAKIMAEKLGWTDEQLISEVNDYLSLVNAQQLITK